jgi:hypothetical protein
MTAAVAPSLEPSSRPDCLRYLFIVARALRAFYSSSTQRRAGRRVSEAVPVAAFQLGCSSSVRAWSIWSYAYVAMAAVVIVAPARASDS